VGAFTVSAWIVNVNAKLIRCWRATPPKLGRLLQLEDMRHMGMRNLVRSSHDEKKLEKRVGGKGLEFVVRLF